MSPPLSWLLEDDLIEGRCFAQGMLEALTGKHDTTVSTS